MPLSTVDALAQLSFLVQGALEREAGDLSVVQTRLLGILRDRTPTMNELATALELDKSSVTGLVDRAERRGLVERRRSESDGRSVQVVLTRSGRTLVNQVAKRFDTRMTDLLASLSARDRATLTRLATDVLVADADERGVDLFPY